MADPVQTQTPRMKALQNLSAQLPVANSRVANGQAAARDMQLQQAVAKAPQSAGTATAQQTGAAVAQNAGSQMVQQAQQNVQQQGQIGQLGLQEQQQQSQATVAGLQAGQKQQAMDNVQKFAQISEKAKQEMFDKQLQFAKDEQGRTLFNDRQLADYARVNAKTNEDYQNYAQNAEQLSKRKLQVMEQAYKIAMEDLQHKQAIAEQSKDQESIRQINATKKAMEERIQSERNEAANNGAKWAAGGTIVGGAAGAATGSPQAAQAGASAGGAAGGMIGSQQ